MTANSLSLLWAAGMRELCNHLWQSTLFAGVVLLLAHILRKYQARTRYWLWMAASVKFLIPFSLLAVAVSHLQWLTRAGESQAAAFTAMHQMSQPFTEVTGLSGPITSLAAPATLHYPLAPLVLLLSAVWMLGCITVLVFWFAQWSRVARSVRTAKTLHEGREVEALRRMERTAGSKRPIDVISSPDSMEPGVFGILRPVLLWPQGISRHLDDAHLEAVLAHEVCHVRWRDNLTAMLPMLVSAIFWFHPLVWWMKQQLVKERELACDEEVVHLCNQPQVYAESILKICEFCIESPLPCVSGITGADLKKRVVNIMAAQVGLTLGVSRKLLLLAVVAATVAFGLYGQAVPDSVKLFHATGPMPSYEVATIKRPDDRGVNVAKAAGFAAGAAAAAGGGAPGVRLSGNGIAETVRRYIQYAYGIPMSSGARLTGGPAWINSDMYVIEGKVPDELRDAMQKMPPAERINETRMLQQVLLQQRFKLKVHFEMREMPVYELVAARGGLKIKAVPPPPPGPLPPRRSGDPIPPGGGGVGFGNGHETMTAMATTIPALISIIGSEAELAGRPIVDKTGFAGNFDVVGMKWASSALPAGFGGTSSPDPDATSLFTALEEKLGMKLVPGKAPVEVVVIDSIERPTEN